MLAKDISKGGSPVPAYGTTRHTGATDLQLRSNHFCTNASLRNVVPKSLSAFTRMDISSKKMRSKKKEEGENCVCKSSTKLSTLSICGRSFGGSTHCTCASLTELKEEQCTCLLKSDEEDSEISCKVSVGHCTNMKKMYKLTDTSETKLTDSYEKLVNCLKLNDEANLYNLDLFEPHPREIRVIEGKNLPPTGFDVSLILPQCVCLISDKENDDKAIQNEKVDGVYKTESETLSDLVCVPSIPQLLWDNMLQSGETEKIAEKYTTYLFQDKIDASESISVPCPEVNNEITKNTNSDQPHCLHTAFLKKLKKSSFPTKSFKLSRALL